MDWDREKERRAGKVVGIGSSVYAVIFALVWNVLAAATGAYFMLIFGLPFLGFMIFRLVVLLKKSKPKSQDPWEQAEAPPQLHQLHPGTLRRQRFLPLLRWRSEAGIRLLHYVGDRK